MTISKKGMRNMSDDAADKTFTRSRSAFGADAIMALDGIALILQALKEGYILFDNHNGFVALEKELKALTDFTRNTYVK